MFTHAMVDRKDTIPTVEESSSLKEALTILETSGFRCVPVLDQSKTMFRGNIYKMHIYRHIAQGGDLNLPVTYLLKNATKYVRLTDSFFKIFFTIKELPYIAVLNEKNQFYGIITHQTLLQQLAHGWRIDEGDYVLTLKSNEIKNEFILLTKIISKYTTISNLVTQKFDEETPRIIFVSFPTSIPDNVKENMLKHLEKKKFSVLALTTLGE